MCSQSELCKSSPTKSRQYVPFLVVNSSGVELALFYFPPVPQAPLGVSVKPECPIFTVYTSGVICLFKFELSSQSKDKFNNRYMMGAIAYSP